MTVRARALEIALTLIDIFNNGLNEDEERYAVENVLNLMSFKILKTFSFKNLKRFHEMNMGRKLPNNSPISSENTIKAQELRFYLDYLDEHTIDSYLSYLSDRAVRDVPSDCKW